jgi:hypothetical protein
MTFKQDLRQLMKKHLDKAERPRDFMLIAAQLYDASHEVDDEADRQFTREQWAADLEELETMVPSADSNWEN